jgi:hypothetical protein
MGRAIIRIRAVSSQGSKFGGADKLKVNGRGTSSKMRRIFFVYQLHKGAKGGRARDTIHKNNVGSIRGGMKRFVISARGGNPLICKRI